MSTYPTGVGLRGLNRAGAEFGDDWDGWNGQTFYTVPNEAQLMAELGFYADKGFNALRLPVSWERLQHQLTGSLDPDYQQQVMAVVERATAAGWTIVVDLHNYNRYATGAFDADGMQTNTYAQHVLGDGVLDVSHLADVWTRLATLWAGNARVIFNLMNEPHDFPLTSESWFAAIQTVIDAIRTTGAAQLILVPNSRGSDVTHWNTYAPNGGALDSEAALAIVDPANNVAFDMHAYLDEPDAPAAYVDLVRPVTDWAIANDRRLFLSEFGVASTAPNGSAALDQLFAYLNANSSVWVGWTAWNLPPYNITQAGNYVADGPAMAWYTPHLRPNIVQTRNTFAVIRERGPAWDPALAMQEQAAWTAHAAFMNGLAATGFVVRGGPLGDGSKILLIVSADSPATIVARLADDPWTPLGLLSLASVDEWHILLGDPDDQAVRLGDVRRVE
jgi:endoglucanase